MNEFRIRTLNRIDPEGLRLLDKRFRAGPDEEDPHGILVRSAGVDTDGFPSLLAVARAGAGVNNITVQKATARGICVFNTPGANANAVAELVMTMLGMAARKIHDGLAFCARLAGSEDAEIARQVEASKSQFRGFELAGKTLGVLGLGKIGVRVANAAALQRMRVVGFDPLPALDNVHELLPQVTLARSSQDVVRQADVLTVHVPLDNSTRGMVGAALLAQLPAGALLVNYARGQVVDEPAVLQALDGGRLAAYITDFPSAALLKHPRVLATPHLGASTEESEEQCARMAVQELRAYLEHGTVTHSVNFPTAESMPPSGARTRLIMINRDIPDMIGFVSHAIGSRRINICSYLNESNGTIGYNIIDVEQAIPAEVLAEIGRHPGVIRTRTIDCGQG